MIKSESALLELTVMNAEAGQFESFATAAKTLLDRGLPPELVTRLQDLWDKTKFIGGELVAVGKIIIKKIADFFLANPGLAIGLAIGAALAALISASIPFIGALLAPLVVIVSTLYGYNIQLGGRDSLLHSTFILAKEFFMLLVGIFTAVANYVTA
jgi:hypothetical protein